MDPLDIQYQLRKRGISQDEIARRAKRSKALVSMVIHGKARNAHIERLIARAIGRPVAEVFPDDIPLKTAA